MSDIGPDEDGHCTRCGLLWEQDEIDGLLTHECPPGFLISAIPPTPEQVKKASDTPRTDALFIWQQWVNLLPGGVVEQWYHLALALERELAAERKIREEERGAMEKVICKWSEEVNLVTHKCITCGVAAEHPDPDLTRTGAYASKWNSQQAEAVRRLRQRCDAAERDAARYRWLKSRFTGAADGRLWAVVTNTKEAGGGCLAFHSDISKLDDAADAAIAAQTKP